jgi:hypothetical protein
MAAPAAISSSVVSAISTFFIRFTAFLLSAPR